MLQWRGWGKLPVPRQAAITPSATWMARLVAQSPLTSMATFNRPVVRQELLEDMENIAASKLAASE